MAPFFVRTEKRTVATLCGHGANVYEFFGSVLGLQLESMTIFYFFLSRVSSNRRILAFSSSMLGNCS